MQKGKHNARAHMRRPYHGLCRLGTAKSTLAATLVDASAAGIQCRVSNGLLPQVGESIYVEWQDTSAIFAEVIWIRGRQLGLRFASLEPDYADRLDAASLGFENYSRTIAFQIAQAKSQA
jgi:hypothetical protein